ncbi:hypothetical protein [Nocardia sp. R6R-6]|uniref:hypothetical protein n=1 Tax=Nocardia sp. R6R-6 TaxID=3459303 RepID=UPI00403DF8A9
MSTSSSTHESTNVVVRSGTARNGPLLVTEQLHQLVLGAPATQVPMRQADQSVVGICFAS